MMFFVNSRGFKCPGDIHKIKHTNDAYKIKIYSRSWLLYIYNKMIKEIASYVFQNCTF